jgi:hypothetical protein
VVLFLPISKGNFLGQLKGNISTFEQKNGRG